MYITCVYRWREGERGKGALDGGGRSRGYEGVSADVEGGGGKRVGLSADYKAHIIR